MITGQTKGVMMAENSGFITDIWRPFGLTANPFFQSELRADPNSAYPARTLLVGRDDLLRTIGRRIGSDACTRTIIEGAAGVGKTSFVNRLKAELAHAGGFIVHDQPVRITTESTPDRFLADVLRVLVRAFTHRGGVRDAFWDNAALLVESRMLSSGGVTVGPVGVQYQRQRAGSEVGHEPLVETIAEALGRFRSRDGLQILIHVNNLENLALEEARAAGRLLQNVRDVFLQPGAHWLMVGSVGIEQALFRQSDQVGGIFPPADVVAPLSPSEVERMLDRRYDHLRERRASVTPPVEPAAAARLYARYRGDLRSFLRMLEQASNLMLGIEGVKPLTEEQILATVGAEYRTRVLREIEGDGRHLERIVAHAGTGEFRVAEVQQWTNVSQGGASGIVARLLEARLIREDRRHGKSVYYRLVGDAIVAFLPQVPDTPEPGAHH